MKRTENNFKGEAKMVMNTKQMKEALRVGSTMNMIDEMVVKMQLNDEEKEAYYKFIEQEDEEAAEALILRAHKAIQKRS